MLALPPSSPPTWVIPPGGRLLCIWLWWGCPPLVEIVAGIVGGVGRLLRGKWTAIGWGVGLAIVAWREGSRREGRREGRGEEGRRGEEE